MTVCAENSKEYTPPKIVELISEFNKVTEYKINTHIKNHTSLNKPLTTGN